MRNTSIDRHSKQFSAYFVSYFYFIFATNSAPRSVKSNKNAKWPRVVPTLQTKLKVTADFEAGK
jgi:F0F1-type ATP synthase membrane subunit a